MSTIQLYALHCGGDLMAMAVFDPFDPEPARKVYNPYFLYVVKHPSGTLLFDSGAHPELATHPESRLGEAAAEFEVRLSPDDHIESRLSAIGLRPSDVDLSAIGGRAHRELPAPLPDRVAELLDEVEPVAVAGDDDGGRRLVDHAVDPVGAVLAADDVLADGHPRVRVDLTAGERLHAASIAG